MNQARGFTLIELMIAVTLGMLAVAAVGSVFIYGSRNYKQDDRISRMQDELRFAMTQITQDIEMADFWAQVANPVQNVVVSGALDVNCGPTTDGGASTADNNWVFRERRSGIATIGNATTAQANATFACIPATDFVAGTDILGIKRLGGQRVTATEQDRVYVRTNGIQTLMYEAEPVVANAHLVNPPPTGENVSIYEFKPAIWFVRSFTNVAGDGVPCLSRVGLIAGPDDRHDCIASGIEDMQLEFGFDNDGNGVADRFVEYAAGELPTATTLARVVAVRVHLLARALEPDPEGSYRNQKTYRLASKVIDMTQKPDADQRYYRRTMSSVVLMRNQAYRQSPFALPSS